MDIMLKGNNGEKVVIPIEDLIQKYWSDENSLSLIHISEPTRRS